MHKLLITICYGLWFLNEATAQVHSTGAPQYIDTIDAGIKKGVYKKMQAKMNCYESWQRLYVDASGKVVKALGGIPKGCYQMEKVIYLKHDSAVYYIEDYQPVKRDPDCKSLAPQSFGYKIQQGQLLVTDLYTKALIEVEEPEAVLQSIKTLYKAVYRDFNSICYREPDLIEKHKQEVNAQIIAGKIKPEKLTESDDSLGTITAYKRNGELVLLKTRYKGDSIAKSYNMYFLKGSLVDYSFDHEVLIDGVFQLKVADRFQMDDDHIKNFSLLEIANPAYKHKSEADIIKELTNLGKSVRVKYNL